MTNLFKKTLVAAAIVGASASTAYATPEVNVTTIDLSAEGAVLAGEIAVPDITITLDSDYTENDLVRITFGDATLVEIDDLTTAGDAITFGQLQGASASEVLFRITDILDGVDTNGVVVTLSGIVLDADTILDDNDDVTVSFQGLLSDGTTVIESSVASMVNDVVTVSTQFEFGDVEQELDAVIDVDANRQEFVDGDEDVLVLSFEEETGLTLAATATTVTTTIFGDFSYSDTDGDGEPETAFTATGGDDSFSVEVADDFTYVMVTQGVSGEIDNLTLALEVAGEGDGNPVIADQTFSANVSLAFEDSAGEDDSVVLTTGESVGEWTLNGAQIFVPFLPVNRGPATLINRIVVANEGNQDGAVEVEAFDEAGVSYGPFDLGVTIDAGSTTVLTGIQIAEALGVDEAGILNLAVTLTVNASADDITATGFIERPGTTRQILAIEVE